MSTDTTQIYDLQKEWRAIVLDKLSILEKNQADLKTNISDMKTSFANQAEFATLKTKVEALENFKSKAMGVIVGVNFVGMLLGSLITYIISIVK